MTDGREKPEDRDEPGDGMTEEELDETIEESFPASDPLPPPTHPGRPERKGEDD